MHLDFAQTVMILDTIELTYFDTTLCDVDVQSSHSSVRKQ